MPAWPSRSFLAWRLCDVQALKGAIYAKQALAQRSDTVEVFARRGSILDRNGNVLVRSLPSESVYAVPREIVDPVTTAAKLERIFGKLDPATVAALHDRHLWFVWIARKVPHETAARVRSLGLDRRRFKGRRDGAARRHRWTACLDDAGLRRHRRKRSRRHRVRLRRHAARSIRTRHPRSRRVRTADTLRTRASRRAGAAGFGRRADDRSLPAVRRRASAGQAGQRRFTRSTEPRS